MARLRNANATKAARAEAKAARKAAAKERRSQLWQAFNIQRQEDKRLLPYMIGAFVLIVGVSVAVGIWSGGFTMVTMIPLGVVLGDGSGLPSPAGSTPGRRREPVRRPPAARSRTG